MTKSEAKAIQQRMGRAARILNGTSEPDAIKWPGMTVEQREAVYNSIKAATEEQREAVYNSIKAATEECTAVLEMASAELGFK